MKEYQIWEFIRPKLTITETLVFQTDNKKELKKELKRLKDQRTEKGITYYSETVRA